MYSSVYSSFYILAWTRAFHARSKVGSSRVDPNRVAPTDLLAACGIEPLDGSAACAGRARTLHARSKWGGQRREQQQSSASKVSKHARQATQATRNAQRNTAEKRKAHRSLRIPCVSWLLAARVFLPPASQLPPLPHETETETETYVARPLGLSRVDPNNVTKSPRDKVTQ